MNLSKRVLSVFLVAVMLLCSAPLSGVTDIDFASLFALKASAETYGDYEYTVSGSNATITKYKGSASTVNIPSTINGKTVTAIAYGAFADNASLTKVSIPSTVLAIGTTYYNTGAFQNCSKLQTVTFAAGSNNAYIGTRTFQNCKNLASINIPGNYATICSDAFSNCSALSSLILNKSGYSVPNQVISSVAFSGCTNLKTVSLPTTLKSIDNDAFNGCTSISELVIPEGVTTIGIGAFANNTSLTKVTIPSTVTAIGTTYYNTGAFQNCSKLQTVTFAAGSNDAYIGTRTFQNCKNLAIVHIPSNYKSIYNDAFANTNSTFYICNTTGNCYAKQYADSNGFNFRICSGHTVTPPVTQHTATFIDRASKRTATGGKITLPAITTYSGWTAEGWTELSKVPVSLFMPAGMSFEISKDMTYYAVYSKEVKLTLDPNGGSGSYMDTKKILYNSCGLSERAIFTLSDYNVTRKGYKLLGWSTNKNASSAQVSPSADLTLDNSATYYAVWQKDTTPTPYDPTSITRSVTMNYKETKKLDLEGFKYTKIYSDNEKIATVNKDGEVYAAKKGSTKIHAVDSLGNEMIFDITVKYTALQWFIKIVLFGWIWY